MKEFRRLSQSSCGIIWIAAFGLLFCTLMNPTFIILSIFTFIWAIWATGPSEGVII